MAGQFLQRLSYERVVIAFRSPLGGWGSSEDCLVDAFNKALTALIKALVRARLEPEDITVNVGGDVDSDGNLIVARAILEDDVAVEVEATDDVLRFSITYPKTSPRARSRVRRLEKRLIEALSEPLTRQG